MSRVSRSRNTPVAPLLHRRLDHYVLAATAAGVGLFATQSSDASVVYTHANFAFSNGQNCILDLNGDGSTDFLLRDVFYLRSTGRRITLYAQGMAPGNSMMGFTSEDARFKVAVARNQGARIAFTTGLSSAVLAKFSSTCAGNHYVFGRWVNVQNKYLALKFVVNGETHFGWARLSVHVNQAAVNAYLTGYAYETIPGKAIIAGQTSDSMSLIPNPTAEPADQNAHHDSPPFSLGLLALGALGLPPNRH